MVTDLQVIGLRGDAQFSDIVDHFLSLGGDVVLMDPKYVYCKEQVISAVEHAERAFRHGTNRSKTMLTEIIMYTAGERQISAALGKMKQKNGKNGYVAAVLGIKGDLALGKLGMVRDDSLLKGTPEKAKAMGLKDNGIPYIDQALELVALLDIAK